MIKCKYILIEHKYAVTERGHQYQKIFIEARMKVQSCTLNSNKYMIVSTQITNIEVFAFIAVLVFKFLSRTFLFINRKDKRNCLKVGYFLRK